MRYRGGDRAGELHMEEEKLEECSVWAVGGRRSGSTARPTSGDAMVAGGPCLVLCEQGELGRGFI